MDFGHLFTKKWLSTPRGYVNLVGGPLAPPGVAAVGIPLKGPSLWSKTLTPPTRPWGYISKTLMGYFWVPPYPTLIAIWNDWPILNSWQQQVNKWFLGPNFDPKSTHDPRVKNFSFFVKSPQNTSTFRRKYKKNGYLAHFWEIGVQSQWI